MYNNSSLNDYHRVLVLSTTKQASMAVPRPEPTPRPEQPAVAPPKAQSQAALADDRQRDWQREQRDWRRMTESYRKAAEDARGDRHR